MKKILIVDDEQKLLETMSQLIQGIDGKFEIFAANNGESALKLMEASDIDLLITDINMPDMDGLELIKEIRRKESNIKLVAMSGAGQLYLRAANAFGADYILEKPFGKDELKLAINEAFR